MLSTTQKLAQVGSWIWNVGTGEVIWTDEVYRIFGLDPETFTPKIDSIMKRFHPDYQQVHQELINKAINSRKPFTFETQIIRPDGSFRSLISTSGGEYDVKGNLINLFGSVQDITESKRIRDALQESEERYRTLFEQSTDSIIIIDVDSGELLELNEKAYKSLGYTRDEFKKIFLSDIEVVESHEEISAHIKKIKNESIDIFETKHKTKAGDIRDILVKVKSITISGKEYIQCILNDITERKRIEEALFQSEERLALMMECTGLGLWDQDFISGEVFRNDLWAKMLEFEPKDIDSKLFVWKDLIHPDDLSNVEQTIKQHEAGLTPLYKVEHRMKTKSGNWKWILNWGKVVQRDAEGKPLRALGIHLDISDRKEMEEALRSSEVKYRSLVQNFQGIVFKGYEDFSSEYFFGSVQEITGYSPDDFLNDKIRLDQLIHPKDQQRIKNDVEQFMSSAKKTAYREYRIIDKNNTVHWISENIEKLFDQTKNMGGVYGIIQDITNRKEEEVKLQMFQFSIDQSMEAVFWMNKKAEFTYVNDQACSSLGYTREELLGKPLWDIDPIYPKERWDADWEQYQKERKGGEVFVETIHRRKNGDEFPVEIYIRHLWFGDSKLHIAVARDITERKKTEVELKKYREHLEELVKERTAELEEKNKELERMNNLFVGREFRIKELRDKIEELNNKLNQN